MSEYVVIGDTEDYKGCLVYVCYGDYDTAKAIVDRLASGNWNDNDKVIAKGHTNFRVKEIPKEDCWWNQGGLD